MRIAVLIAGESRFSPATDTLIDILPKSSEYQVDWFFYLNQYSNKVSFRPSSIADCWKSFDRSWAIDKIKSRLPSNHSIIEIETPNVEIPVPDISVKLAGGSTLGRTYLQFYNIFRADMLRQEFENNNNFKYDLVVRARNDILIDANIDYKHLRDHLDTDPTSVFTPIHHRHGFVDPQVNDFFAITSSDNMKVYANLCNEIPQDYHNTDRIYHTESCLSYQLTKHGLSIKFLDIKFDPSLLDQLTLNQHTNFGIWGNP